MGYTRNDLPSGGGDYFKAKSPEFADRAKLRLTISGVDMKHFDAKGDEEAKDKLILSFEESDKLMIVNYTNGEILFDEIGDDTDTWIGAQVVLYVGATKMGDGVKVKVPEVAKAPPAAKGAKAPPAAKAAAPKASTPLDDDDDYS